VRGLGKEVAIRATVLDRHELWAELERVRRDVATLRHRLDGREVIENVDLLPILTARLEAAEAEEHDLLARLAGIEQT
jgi:hypothetical protein